MGLVRVALALAVLLAHLPTATIKFMHGGLAVQGFFIVSGFYMALVLDAKYTDKRMFYSNRLLRLAPLYFGMLLLAAIALFGFGITATAWPAIFESAYGNPLSAVVLVLQNLLVVGQEMLYWFKIAPDGALYLDPAGGLPTEAAPIAWQALLVPQSWSLSMELMFYAMAPFLARLRTRNLLLIALASIALRIAGGFLPVEYGLWQGRFFPTALFLFVFGMLAYRLKRLIERCPRWMDALAFVATLALIVALPQLGLGGEASRWLTYIVLTVALPLVFRFSRDHAFDRWVGDLSYPIYLSHLLVVALVLTFQPPLPSWVAILTTLALSAVMLVVVDRPVDRWRQRRVTRQMRSSAPDLAAPAPGLA